MSDVPAAIPLVVEDLSFRYRSRETLAIQNISFELHPGELLLIAGSSGCGKTTLLRCLNGLIPRSYKGDRSGKILLYGQDTSGLLLSQISQKIGTVLQDPERQILGTRVLNEVAFGLENLGLPREEILDRAEATLSYLGISHLRDRETPYLSGGEKQKVALAGVLAMRAGVLLLDEPLASLDPASAQETLATVRRMVDEGMSVLMVEHRVEDVLSIHPERFLYMTDGQVRYLGDVAGLSKVVDYHEIKMPTPMILERAARETAVEISHSGLHPERVADKAQPALVRFENVSYSYEPGVGVLENVSLDIHRGDIIAVLGPNGAGKTTLVKHAIGLLKPRRGRVLVGGKDTHELSVAQVATTLGYVFQSPSHMLFAPTVAEELAFGPKNLRHPPTTIEKEVREAIEIVNLKGREQDPPLSLSFGQQKRVSIAAILAMQSRILIMDEPTAGQDYRNYMDFMDAILNLPSFEAILFITHDLDLAVIFANRILLLNRGRLVADGPPPAVLSNQDQLLANRVVPTSLLKANLEYYPKTGSFFRAETLARAIALKPGNPATQ